MAFARATWHSGLTYSQTCRQCGTQVLYKDDKLDFRPWYPDGFVYCPTCSTPLRHNETYAIDRPDTAPVVDMTASSPTPHRAPAPSSGAFCTNCGRAYGEGERFCADCGNRR